MLTHLSCLNSVLILTTKLRIKKPNMKRLTKPAYALAAVAFALLTACGSSSTPAVVQENEIADSLTDLVDEALEEVETEEAWKQFTSEDGNFTVLFPEIPEDDAQNVDTELGQIKMHTFMHEISSTEIMMIAYSDYPTAFIESTTADELLANGKSGGLGSLFTNPVMDEDVHIKFRDKYEAVKFKAHEEGGGFYVNYLIILKGNRVYQLAKLRDGSYSSQANVEKFYSSFKFLDDEAVEGEAESPAAEM